MIVVVDTSPLNYLILIDQVDLLFSLFGEVLLPHAVHRELQHPKTPERVRHWIAKAPQWLKVHGVRPLRRSLFLSSISESVRPFNWPLR